MPSLIPAGIGRVIVPSLLDPLIIGNPLSSCTILALEANVVDDADDADDSDGTYSNIENLIQS